MHRLPVLHFLFKLRGHLSYLCFPQNRVQRTFTPLILQWRRLLALSGQGSQMYFLQRPQLLGTPVEQVTTLALAF